MDELEQLLARHCAPVLLGEKAANLVAIDPRKVRALDRRVAEWNRAFAKRGLVFTLVCCCERRSLLLVYRPGLLAPRLRRDAQALARFGYAPGDGLESHLERLKTRLQAGPFPHEIGFFLDYPTEDVLAFVEQGGAACKLCGYWKVYGDVEAARARFARFDACRAAVWRSVQRGVPLARIVRAAS